MKHCTNLRIYLITIYSRYNQFKYNERISICFVVDLLRPNGNNSPLVSFSQIGAMFHLSKGAISSHYYKRVLEYRLFLMSKIMKK